MDLDEYKEEFFNHMFHAWKLALENIQKAQVTQKKSYDKKAKEVDLKVGERVMVLMPSETQGKNWKLARPFTALIVCSKLLLQMLKSISLMSLVVDQFSWHWIESDDVTQIKEMRHGQDQRKSEGIVQRMYFQWKQVHSHSRIKDQSLVEEVQSWIILSLLEI